MADWSDVIEAEIVRRKAPYPNILFDVVNFEADPLMRVLVFYAVNIAEFSDNQMVSIAEWINKMLNDLNNSGNGYKYTYHISEETP